MIVGMNIVLNRTVVVDSDRRFDNLCGSHLQSQSVKCIVSIYPPGEFFVSASGLACLDNFFHIFIFNVFDTM